MINRNLHSQGLPAIAIETLQSIRKMCHLHEAQFYRLVKQGPSERLLNAKQIKTPNPSRVSSFFVIETG